MRKGVGRPWRRRVQAIASGLLQVAVSLPPPLPVVDAVAEPLLVDTGLASTSATVEPAVLLVPVALLLATPPSSRTSSPPRRSAYPRAHWEPTTDRDVLSGSHRRLGDVAFVLGIPLAGRADKPTVVPDLALRRRPWMALAHVDTGVSSRELARRSG